MKAQLVSPEGIADRLGDMVGLSRHSDLFTVRDNSVGYTVRYCVCVYIY